MKGRLLVVVVAVLAIALLVSCGAVKSRLPGPLTEAQTAVGDVEGARVELLESKMGEAEPCWGGVCPKITGTARYIPAKVAPKPFSELGCPQIEVEFLDGLGRKVTQVGGWTECGEYDEPENIVPNEPFPFHCDLLEVSREQWPKIATHRVTALGWW